MAPLATERAVLPRGTAPLTDEQRVLHFLRRFTLGPTPASIAEVGAKGIRAWLDQQIAGEVEADAALRARLADMRTWGLSSGELVADFAPPIPDTATGEERAELARLRTIPPLELRTAVLLQAVHDPNQVREAAADFFRNHFCVAIDKGLVAQLATSYERDVIRARVFGSFRAMLGASAKHPAMLVYLDNVISRRPPTKAELKEIEMDERLRTKSRDLGLAARSIAAQRGLNENYARELLELHTLGADNYYTQADVEEVARALTGWTIESDASLPLDFRFRNELHCSGDKRVLRTVIGESWKDPVSEGERVLDLLAEHKGTADFMAWKLCRHFVRDDPPGGMVARVAAVFRREKGDLPALYRAIVDDEEFFAPENFGAKFKRPFEFVVSALRVTGAEIESCTGLLGALKGMDEDLYDCKDPTGYYDQAEAWLDTGALAARWKFARELAEGRLAGVAVPASFYAGLEQATPGALKDELLRRVLPGGVGARTAAALAAVAGGPGRARASRARLAPTLLGVMLGSPEFQEQ
jgi:uncharacterized protein (DUF1800 family)